jgi:O-acetyl-ADP-ribose deacetylase (regulator of RNase III)
MPSTIKEIEGDLIKMAKYGKFDVIVHGCNCYATMGAGIAVAVRNTFPEAYQADRQFKIKNGEKRLGKLSFAFANTATGEAVMVANLYTQLNPGKDFRESALKEALESLKNQIKFLYQFKRGGLVKIGFPLIGCGIGGGDWNRVRQIITDSLSEGFQITIVHFKQSTK